MLKSRTVRHLPDYKSVLRWIFLILGWSAVVRNQFFMESAVRCVNLIALLSPSNFLLKLFQTIAMIVVILAAFPGTWFLCLATAWGLKRDRAWSRWTGACACLTLLPGFPWLTVVGAIGSAVMLVVPPPLGAVANSGQLGPARGTKDYWTSKRDSFAQAAIYFLSMIALIVAMSRNGWIARHLVSHYSLIPDSLIPRWEWSLCALALLFANTTVHELGHATTAWALSHRVNVICIGPFTFSKGPYGYRFQFQWKRLVDSGGYMGSVPHHSRHLRLKQVAIVAAGPAASLLSGLLMLALLFSLPGTQWQSYSPIIAWSSVLGFYSAFVSLLPVGYSDGSMLFHLVVKSHPGELLLDHLVLAQIDEQANVSFGGADFERQAGPISKDK